MFILLGLKVNLAFGQIRSNVCLPIKDCALPVSATKVTDLSFIRSVINKGLVASVAGRLSDTLKKG